MEDELESEEPPQVGVWGEGGGRMYVCLTAEVGARLSPADFDRHSFQHLQKQKAARTFSWDVTPNVVFDIKGPFPTTFSDPVAIWCVPT